MADEQLSYVYGQGEFVREYKSQPYTNQIQEIRNLLDEKYKTNYDVNEVSCTKYNVCFLNRYDNQHNALGWHSDSSKEMNPNHDIAVISLGAEREIWWKQKDLKGPIPKKQTIIARWFIVYYAGRISKRSFA
jgi:alkylated DNA repair dioxygenase AlkB